MKKIIRKLRRRLLFAKFGFSPKIERVAYRMFGSEYGGWPVVTEVLNSQSVVLSFGLGEDISFDLEIMEAFDLTLHGFDPTPKSLAWLSSQELPARFKVHGVGLADKDGELTFDVPANRDHASYSATANREGAQTVSLPVKRIETIFNELALEKIDVLKMDIEGSENSVIADLLKGNIRPVQILVEYHHRIHKTPLTETMESIGALEKAGYRLFWVSNMGDEFAMIMKDTLPST